MPKKIDDIIRNLPAARRKKVEVRAAKLIAEERTLRELRHARKLTQERLAKSMGVKQKQISAIEGRTDMHISTLRRAVEGMGGSLTLVVQFPDCEPFSLAGIGTEALRAKNRHKPSTRAKRAKTEAQMGRTA